MKKIIAGICLVTYFMPSYGIYTTFADTESERYFVVTAYYSPLPNQNAYLRGDYEKEKILNWEGVRGASGKKVFSWMLAAPKWYDFWTKIYLEWVWIGSVEDRGGAIVKAWERGHKHDRIDIWVWYGDEWLKRALAWGKRVVKWKLVEKTKEPSIDVENFKVARFIGSSLAKTSKVLWPNILYKSVGKDSWTSDITELQKVLSKAWLYSGKIDWIYNSQLIETIAWFQKQYKVVSSNDDPGIGFWGRKTRQKFSILYNAWTFSTVKNVEKNVDKKEKTLSLFDTYIQPKSSTEDIKKLQTLLKDIWIYTWEVNGKYSEIAEVLKDYQIKNNIIKTRQDIAAWHFWPKTRVALKKDFDLIQKKKAQEAERLAQIAKLEKESKEEAEKIVNTLGTINPWDTGKRVRELQIILKDIWYFDFQDTGIYGNITKESVIKYQLDNELIKSKNEKVAWVVWPNTRLSLKEDIASQILEEKLQELEPKESTQKEIAISY